MKRARDKIDRWNGNGPKEPRLKIRMPLDLAYLNAVEATLSEWASAEDCAAYDSL